MIALAREMQPFPGMAGQALYHNHQLLLVRRFTAIILLAAFAITQYAKQVNYLECKLSNYFKMTAASCDCEKIVHGGKGTADQSPLPLPHNHIHIDESYLSSQTLNRETHLPGHVNVCHIITHSELREGIHDNPDRPPQFSCS